MLRRNFKYALAALILSTLAPIPAMAGGLPEICGDIGPDVMNLLNRYAATDARNFCVRAMTLAETRCFRQRDQVIYQANMISRRYNLAPVVPGCQPPVLLAAAPPAYVPPPVLAAGAREAVSHASLFAGSWWLLGLLPLGGLAFIGGGGHTETTSTTATNIDDEFNAQYTLSVIGLTQTGRPGSIYNSFTGQGVKVGVIDTGIDLNHPEFAGRIAGAFNFVTNTAGNGPSVAHGTEVAGIIAANRNFLGMHGVAYNAQLLSAQVFDQNNDPIHTTPVNGNSDVLTFTPAIQYLVNNGASIINGSYGPDRNWHDNSNFFGYQLIYPHDLQDGAAYVAAAQAGKILVFPAGDYYAQFPNVAANPTGPGFLPFITPSHDAITGVANGAYRTQGGGTVTNDFSAMIPNTIVVVSTNRTGTISSFSNRCGVAAAWCMAAPGENIFTTAPNGLYTTVSGTSFAAPQVSGAAAILKQEFPSLTGAQIVQILLTTATDLGAVGVDPIYGHGMLNLAKATAPIGSSTLVLGGDINSNRVALQGSSITFGTAFGLTSSQLLSSQNIAFLDGYDRAYTMPANSLIHVGSNAFHADDVLFSYGKPEDRTELKVNDHMSLAFTSDVTGQSDKLTSDKPTAPGDKNFDLKAFVVTQEMGGETVASVHYKDPNALALGFSEADRSRMDRALIKSNLQNPYAAFAANNGYASIIETEALGGKVRVSGFFGRPVEMDTDARNFGSQMETSYNLGGGSKAMFAFGALFENGSVLGTTGEGAFAFGNGTTTVYTGLGTSLALDSKTTLRGAAYAGWTKPNLSDSSLITNMSNLMTTAFNLGIERAGVASKGDRLSLGVAQPIHVEGGSMQFTLPTARDANSSTVYTAQLTQDFGKQGREIDLELNYSVPVAEDSAFSFGALYRHDAGHVAGQDDMLGLVRYTKSF